MPASPSEWVRRNRCTAQIRLLAMKKVCGEKVGMCRLRTFNPRTAARIAADLGIAEPGGAALTGAEVTKEAAKMIIADDTFASIASLVSHGDLRSENRLMRGL